MLVLLLVAIGGGGLGGQPDRNTDRRKLPAVAERRCMWPKGRSRWRSTTSAAIADWRAVLSGAVASSLPTARRSAAGRLPGGDRVVLCCGTPSLTDDVQRRAHGGPELGSRHAAVADVRLGPGCGLAAGRAASTAPSTSSSGSRTILLTGTGTRRWTRMGSSSCTRMPWSPGGGRQVVGSARPACTARGRAPAGSLEESLVAGRAVVKWRLRWPKKSVLARFWRRRFSRQRWHAPSSPTLGELALEGTGTAQGAEGPAGKVLTNEDLPRAAVRRPQRSRPGGRPDGDRQADEEPSQAGGAGERRGLVEGSGSRRRARSCAATRCSPRRCRPASTR